MYVNTHRLQRGLSLVEVFVALLVLSVGLIALAKLQVDLVRGGADARARTIALSLAEEKVEDLRTFARTDGSGAWSTSNAVNPAFVMAWSYIDDNTGGRLVPQATYSSALEVAGVRFTRTWEVDDRDFTNVASGITSRTKDVTVTVSWQNEAGATQAVNTVANLVEIPPGNVALASQPVADRPDGPQIAYTPGVAPEVIGVPIDTGTGKRETTKPLPDVQAQGDYAHEVRFDVVNYHLEGSQNVVDRREEFVTVNCRCTLAASGRGRTPARVALIGNVLRDQPGAVRTDKPFTGTVRTSGSNAKSSQPELCSICCRDHHDGPSVTVGSDTDNNRYNPTDTSDHQHYLRNEITGAYPSSPASVGDAYDEACRLKRVNGVFQVFQDWKLVSILALPENDLQAGTIQNAYKTYVQDFVKDYVYPTAPDPTPPTPSATTLVPGSAAQIVGRAIYIDHLPDNLVTFLTNPTDGRIPNGQPFLEYVPFYELNLTKLANWKLETIDTDAPYPTVDGQTCSGTVSQTTLVGKIACIANQAIVDETVIDVGVYQNYFRGLLKGGPGPAPPNQLDAQVYARTGNSGLTGTFALSAAENSAIPVSNEYRFTWDVGQAISGTVTRGGNAPSPAQTWDNITIATDPPSGGCSLDKTGNASRGFNCTVTTGWTGRVTATWTGTGTHSFTATNNIFPPNVLGPTQLGVSFILDP
jgi:type IV pilus modification protein PilV